MARRRRIVGPDYGLDQMRWSSSADVVPLAALGLPGDATPLAQPQSPACSAWWDFISGAPARAWLGTAINASAARLAIRIGKRFDMSCTSVRASAGPSSGARRSEILQGVCQLHGPGSDCRSHLTSSMRVMPGRAAHRPPRGGVVLRIRPDQAVLRGTAFERRPPVDASKPCTYGARRRQRTHQRREVRRRV